MSTTDVLLLVAMVSCIASAAVLASLARHRIAGLDRWLTAHCLLLVAFGVLVSRRGNYTPPIILTACFCVLAAAVLILHGCRRFAGHPSGRKIECLGLVVTAAAILYWTIIAPDENARAAVMSVVLAYTRIAIGWTIWNSRGLRQRRYGHWLVILAAAAGTVLYVSRAVECIFFANPNARALEPTAWNIAFISAGILSLLLLSIGLVMLANDRLVDHAQRLAAVDELTGLTARRELLLRAEQLLKEARASRSRLSVAIIDLDDFKSINDRFGHPAGDRVLQDFAREVSLRLRPMDLFGRLGGEEFAIFFPHTESQHAAALINSILSSGCDSSTGEHRPHCTFSAGIDECEPDDTLGDLMSRADVALYRAKRNGKARVEVASTDAISVA